MGNVVVANFLPVSSNDARCSTWKLTRALKAAGWVTKASSDATTKDTSGTYNGDKWNGGSSAISGQSGSAATIAAAVNNQVTLTGLTGMTTTSSNHWIYLSGAANAGNDGYFKIVRYVSATSVIIYNPTGVYPDANSGSISWQELDPLLETYSSVTGGFLQNGSWITMQGPSTLKVPLTSAPTGTFVKGENVTQTTSGAQGEIIGSMFDSATTSGYLVIMPRVDGTGGGVHGWDSTDVITGAISGATATPSGTVVEYARELVFWNSSTSIAQMTGYLQTCDTVAESTQRFSYLAANAAGCTATVCPGGGGTSNTFPTIGYVFVGTGGATSTQTFGNVNFTGTLSNTQIMCADATYDTGRSADGSWTIAIGTPSVNSGSYIGYCFTRCDDTEDGDVDPYVMYAPSNDAAYSPSRTSGGTSYTSGGESFTANNNAVFGNNNFRGWRRRGMSSGDAYQNFMGALLATGYNGGGGNVMNQNTTTPDTIATMQSTTVYVAEPLWVVSAQAGSKMRKGTARWIRVINFGNGTDTYGNKSWIQLDNTTAGPAFVCGPWDGSSTPVH
jgi:hypothetical protein